jgi:hypothetical protein
VGQTASQSPLQLNAALLNDAAGNQWALIINGPVSAVALGPGATAAVASVSTFGTAANADVTVSTTDITTGRLIKQGDKGSLNSLLVNTAAPFTGGSVAGNGKINVDGAVVRTSVSFSDFNNVWINGNGGVIEGFSTFQPANRPGGNWFTVKSTTVFTGGTAVYVTQIATVITGEIFKRYNPAVVTGGAWSAWQQVFDSGNTNFNVFGGLAASDRIAQGFAISSTLGIFLLSINSLGSATSITTVGNFDIEDAGSNTLAVVSSFSFNGSSNNKKCVVIATLSGLTVGEPLVISTSSIASKITVNF